MIHAHVWWSLYVGTRDRRVLKEMHLPPIEAALERIDFPWDILVEEENPGLIRLITYQNESGAELRDIVIPLLRRAYQLADGWRIDGLQGLSTGDLGDIRAVWNSATPIGGPPALESIALEVRPGRFDGWGHDDDLADHAL
ncbi:MAG: hypothetical protein AAFQ88_01170 [Pseudomonadota bacterium]